jgi:6-phosphogluconate dehydrogenase
MEDIQIYFEKAADLFEVSEIKQQIIDLKGDLKHFCLSALASELPIPCMLAANDFINSLNQNIHTANIIQAQRDFFGAHTYQRIDAEGGKFFHTIWE